VLLTAPPEPEPIPIEDLPPRAVAVVEEDEDD
jgi:hypothetical protein